MKIVKAHFLAKANPQSEIPGGSINLYFFFTSWGPMGLNFDVEEDGKTVAGATADWLGSPLPVPVEVDGLLSMI